MALAGNVAKARAVEPGSIRPGRQSHAFRLIDELVRCRFEQLYTVWLENNPYYKFNHFLADLCEDGESCSSPPHLSALCSRAETQVFKFTRLRVGSWIERNPDIAHSVRVAHLVRDPRAIYSSRRGLRWCTDYKPCDSAATLCDQMRSDLDAFGELTRRLQINRTYQICFEDLAADPLNEAMRVFGSLGLNYAPSVSEYIQTHTAAAAAAEMRNAHSTKRNSKAVAHMWKRKLSRQKIREIETTCGDVLQRLGYTSGPTSAKGAKA
ncbi:carbohydrate sulfotransferase 1-like [Dermacentor albipictus]|uniref:carbohydrate sulfotransferase 1-like n=1 Tax=Dermacentor albipictus TaxID=60249 RepID=UPI0038FCC189